MINSRYTNYEELTSYDKFVLSKKEYYAKQMPALPTYETVNSNTEIATSSYEDYLINELRRTTPPVKPVMREDEFLVKCTSTAQTKTSDKKINVQFKKYGKIILAVYVIFVLALAFIVIGGSTTGIASNDTASASKISETSVPAERIGAMNIEENQGEESNWFDELCDSLSK